MQSRRLMMLSGSFEALFAGKHPHDWSCLWADEWESLYRCRRCGFKWGEQHDRPNWPVCEEIYGCNIKITKRRRKALRAKHYNQMLRDIQSFDLQMKQKPGVTYP